MSPAMSAAGSWPRLNAAAARWRCIARRPEYIQARVSESTKIAKGDVMDILSLPVPCRRQHRLLPCIHGDTGKFAEQDRQAATNFALAAKEAGVRRIIYLGGLGEQISPHLASRQEVGRILRDSGVETIEFPLPSSSARGV